MRSDDGADSFYLVVSSTCGHTCIIFRENFDAAAESPSNNAAPDHSKKNLAGFVGFLLAEDRKTHNYSEKTNAGSCGVSSSQNCGFPRALRNNAGLGAAR